MILLNPGPVTLSSAVRDALLREDLCHRESEFLDLQSDIREKLLGVYDLDPARWAVGLMTGSGTAAVESMVTSILPMNGKLLSIENGVYGERISRIAEQYGTPLAVSNFAWDQAIDFEQIDRQLSEDQTISHVAVIHHETTTGRLNNLAPLAKICRQHNVQLLLDAVSSFGAESIDFDNWPIAGCAATANKCLHGVPGTCFTVAARDCLPNMHSRNVYLDLKRYIAAQDQRGTPFTQSVQTFYALDAALDEFTERGGLAARQSTYQQRMQSIRNHLESLGVKPLLKLAECSAVLHAYHLPEQTDYQRLHDHLKQSGFVIYAGQGSFAQTLFRISMMGEITGEDIERLKRAFTEALG